MRFIGNKTKLLAYIDDILQKQGAVSGTQFFDFFAGTGSVGKYFKQKGYIVSSSDILYFSYVLQRAYIGFTGQPTFTQLLQALPVVNSGRLFTTPYERILAYLNSIPGKPGFIYQNYTTEGTKDSPQVRMFFKGDNGQKIDAIRHTIEEWHTSKLISEDEYFILLATLIESVPFYANISGVFGAFLKTYDSRATKDFTLRPIELPAKGAVGEVFHANSMDLATTITTDILYLDPPYNARQYAPNYHILETIARNDSPTIKGVAGIRPYANQKSEFCNKLTALEALDRVAKTAQYKILALSYNTEGIMSQDAILSTLRQYGKAAVHEVDYRRYKSNSGGAAKHTTHIKEQLYILQAS